MLRWEICLIAGLSILQPLASKMEGVVPQELRPEGKPLAGRMRDNSPMNAQHANDNSPIRVLPEGKPSLDERLTKQRKLDDKYHPWEPPTDLKSHETWHKEAREQLQVSLGLWPMPEKTPLNAKITGTIDRDDYVIEKVYFQSIPGHYVTGNVYRPKSIQRKMPGVLTPHGHWANGRFYDAGEQATVSAILQKGEQFVPNSRFPLQARMATLARMGCVVFHYDMVGYADSNVIDHRAFTNSNAVLGLQSVMGLQTWNSIRALDYLMSRSDVDASRIGVTGASGGGTQTFILCAIDDRPTVAFPAVMVSTDMQGGCVCENCALLRIGRNNVEFAAMFAPKPQAMSGADDWTINIERSGLPELKRLYKLLGAENNVSAECFPQFKHNYNQVSREMMYAWFNQHLKLGRSETNEQSFDPVAPSALSVFDAAHPLSKDAKSAEQLQQWWTRQSSDQMARLEPKDAVGLSVYREVIQKALMAMVHDQFPPADQVKATNLGTKTFAGFSVDRIILSRKTRYETEPKPAVPAIVFKPNQSSGRFVIWLADKGHASLWDAKANQPIENVRKLLSNGVTVVSPDVFLTGEYPPAASAAFEQQIDRKYVGYTYCYNRTVFAERVSDVITAVAFARHLGKAATIDLIARDESGMWGMVAKAICGSEIRRTAIKPSSSSFLTFLGSKTTNPNMLPGALKYGDVRGILGVSAPSEMMLSYSPSDSSMSPALFWKAAAKEQNLHQVKDATEADFVNWLLRP